MQDSGDSFSMITEMSCVILGIRVSGSVASGVPHSSTVRITSFSSLGKYAEMDSVNAKGSSKCCARGRF